MALIHHSPIPSRTFADFLENTRGRPKQDKLQTRTPKKPVGTHILFLCCTGSYCTVLYWTAVVPVWFYRILYCTIYLKNDMMWWPIRPTDGAFQIQFYLLFAPQEVSRFGAFGSICDTRDNPSSFYLFNYFFVSFFSFRQHKESGEETKREDEYYRALCFFLWNFFFENPPTSRAIFSYRTDTTVTPKAKRQRLGYLAPAAD